MSVTNATGSGGGWSLTITSTQYHTTSIPVYKLNVTASSIIGVSLSCRTSSPCKNPGNILNYPLPIPAATAPAPQEFFQAITNSGLGTFTITPTIAILIPAKTNSGAYNSTAILTVVQTMSATGVQAGGLNGYQQLVIGQSNTGNIMHKPSGTLQVIDSQKNVAVHISLKLDTFLPQTSINYPVTITGSALGVGTYTATLYLIFGTGQTLHYTTIFTITLQQLT
jgi:hypothetical protein